MERICHLILRLCFNAYIPMCNKIVSSTNVMFVKAVTKDNLHSDTLYFFFLHLHVAQWPYLQISVSSSKNNSQAYPTIFNAFSIRYFSSLKDIASNLIGAQSAMRSKATVTTVVFLV